MISWRTSYENIVETMICRKFRVWRFRPLNGIFEGLQIGHVNLLCCLKPSEFRFLSSIITITHWNKTPSVHQITINYHKLLACCILSLCLKPGQVDAIAQRVWFQVSLWKGLRGWVPVSYFGFESLTIWKYSWIFMNIHPFPDFEKIECFWCCMMLWSDALCGLFPSRKASVSTGWMPGGAPSKSESVSWSIWSRRRSHLFGWA